MLSSKAQDFFDRIRSTSVSDQAPFNLEEARRHANAFGRMTVEPEPVTIKEIFLDGIRTLQLTPGNAEPDRRLIFMHGGAFALMSPESHQRLAGHVALACRAETCIPEYSLAPEFPFPRALEDTVAVLYSVVPKNSLQNKKTILVGESAGGALALGGVMRLREKNMPLPACIVLMCPWLDLTLTGESITRNKNRAIILSQRNLEIFVQLYLETTGVKASDPQVSPLFNDLGGLPPIYCQAAEHDLLLDDSVRLSHNIASRNNKMQLDIFPSLCHSFQFFAGQFPEAAVAINKIGIFIDNQLS